MMLTIWGIFCNVCVIAKISVCCVEYPGVSITSINVPVYPVFPWLVPYVKIGEAGGMGLILVILAKIHLVYFKS